MINDVIDELFFLVWALSDASFHPFHVNQTVVVAFTWKTVQSGFRRNRHTPQSCLNEPFTISMKLSQRQSYLAIDWHEREMPSTMPLGNAALEFQTRNASRRQGSHKTVEQQESKLGIKSSVS